MVILRSKLPQTYMYSVSTFVIYKMLIEILRGRYQEKLLEEKIDRNQSFSEFFKTEAIDLKKLAQFFQDTIHLYSGHLQLMIHIDYFFSLKASVE